LMAAALHEAGFSFAIPEGSYYILADYAELSDRGDVEFAKWMAREIGVATVPGSSFYHAKAEAPRRVRFAFCKRQETLEAAGERLAGLRALV
jgi:aspartate/methionine/tyrosine aminotransferase